jgi:hypothetical protein
LNSFVRATLLGSVLTAAALAPACGVGTIADSPRGASGAAGSGAVTPSSTGAAGSSSPTGSATGAAGVGTSAGATGAGTSAGAAGTSGGGAGSAGTTGTGTGAAGTGSGAAGTSGAAGGTTATAGRAGTAGAGGATTTTGMAGAAGPTTTGAAGTGSTLPPVTAPHCKRGEAYQSNSLADLKVLSKGISWWYNWTTSPDKGVATTYPTTGVEFVPMIWGGTPDPATIEKQIPKGAKYVLGFNEPNFGTQSHITAAQAATLWPRIEQIAHDLNLKIGSPAPNYCAGDCNDTDPIHYLDTFFAACTGCQVDFIAAHWYACTGDALKNYLSKLKKYGKPIWLTEFSCMDAGDHTAAGEQTYMKAALDILENDPMIFRYSWFTGRWANPSGVSLLAGDGQLTDLGNLYVTSPATSVCGQ